MTKLSDDDTVSWKKKKSSYDSFCSFAYVRHHIVLNQTIKM